MRNYRLTARKDRFGSLMKVHQAYWIEVNVLILFFITMVVIIIFHL